MTTDTERISALEVENAGLKARMGGLESWLESIDGKVDDLRAVANMGKGALWLALKLGAAVLAIGTAIAWFTDHLRIAFR